MDNRGHVVQGTPPAEGGKEAGIWLVAAAAMLTSIALIGWGVWRLFTL